MRKEQLDQQRTRALQKEFQQGFPHSCGIKLVKLHRGWAESQLEVAPRHTQQDGFVHAGVMATMADHTAGYAGFSVIADEYRILTMEFKINYLRPASGPRLRCQARIVKEGKRVLVADSEIFAQQESGEKLVAKALVTLMAVPAYKVASKGQEKG
ncbi:MAG: PaaI family thioesterase [Deltaproteobacteria bacterium]|nr:PaaI family thioesterase [Deltaproteobacteria bacterium]MBW2072761.1 PaaI family thioesterase [Deltaproteobacteria bacterium]